MIWAQIIIAIELLFIYRALATATRNQVKIAELIGWKK